MKRKLLLSTILFCAATGISAQPFPCDGAFFVVMIVDGKSILHELRLDESGRVKTRTILLSEPDRQYACLGMSIEDLHLYALDFHTKELLRIDAGGHVANLGVPENLDLSLDYWAGDVSPEGRRLVVVGRDKVAGIDKSVFSINLTTANHYAGSVGIVAYLHTAITDIATDPVRGIQYGYDKINRQIVNVGTNAITHHNHTPISPVMEALFFDKEGALYGYGSGGSEQEQMTLYAIDKIRGGATAIANSETGMWSDGCSCAFSLYFSRTITPSRLFPCSEFSIEYKIVNHAGVGKTGVVLKDLLPEPFLITEVVDHTFTLGNIASGKGTNELLISNLDILIGENIIVVKGVLDDAGEETYETQAVMEGLPRGLGERLLSDNPQSSAPMDPNIVRIYRAGDLQLEDYVSFDCSGDTAVLSLPFIPETCEWSTGSLEPRLKVTEPGLYWVRADRDCFFFEDSVIIANFPETLALDIGDRLEVKEGTPLHFAFETNAGEIRQLRWWSSGDFDLSCDDCPFPKGNAVKGNTYFLELTDAGGCSVVDSVRVSVVPARNLYVPNVFSPNGDGVNDVFYIQGVAGIGSVKRLLIFDRWGNLIFMNEEGEINHPDSGWDGKVKGATVQEGAYVWVAVVEFWDGQTARLSGEVTVLAN